MDIGTVNFDDLFDFSPEPPPPQEKCGESWERESARLTGDWGQGQQRLNTVRTITSAAAVAHQHNQVSNNMARYEEDLIDKRDAHTEIGPCVANVRM